MTLNKAEQRLQSKLADLRNKRERAQKARQLEEKATELEAAAAAYIGSGGNFSRALDGTNHLLTDQLRLAVHNASAAAAAGIGEMISNLRYAARQLRSPPASPLRRCLEPKKPPRASRMTFAINRLRVSHA